MSRPSEPHRDCSFSPAVQVLCPCRDLSGVMGFAPTRTPRRARSPNVGLPPTKSPASTVACASAPMDDHVARVGEEQTWAVCRTAWSRTACGCDLTASIPGANGDRGAAVIAPGATVSLIANGTLSDDVPQAGGLVVAAAGLEFLRTDLSESGEVGVFITTTAPRARPSRSTRSTSASNFRPAAPGASSSRRPPAPNEVYCRSPAMAKAAWSPP